MLVLYFVYHCDINQEIFFFTNASYIIRSQIWYFLFPLFGISWFLPVAVKEALLGWKTRSSVGGVVKKLEDDSTMSYVVYLWTKNN